MGVRGDNRFVSGRNRSGKFFCSGIFAFTDEQVEKDSYPSAAACSCSLTEKLKLQQQKIEAEAKSKLELERLKIDREMLKK